MIAKDHNKLLGMLFLGVGGLELVSNLFALVYVPISFNNSMRDLKAQGLKDLPPWFESIPTIILAIVLFGLIVFTIPKIIAGIGLIKEKSWGRIAGIVAGIGSIIGIPIGTALGIYALWFLFGDEGKAFYLGGNQQQYNNQLPPHSWR